MLTQILSFVRPMEQAYKKIEFFEGLCERIEAAVVSVEEIVFSRKSLFKKQLNEAEVKLCRQKFSAGLNDSV